MEVSISKGKNERNYKIDEFISFLQQQKEKGATHLRFEVANDPMWRFEWLETFRIKSENEIKQEKIKQLETELNNLKRGV